MAIFFAGQKLTAAALNNELKKILARGRRTTASSTTTTIVGVLRLDDVPILANRSYRIRVSGIFSNSTVPGDRTVTEVRYTTDGSTPTTSSPVLPGAQAYQIVANANSDTVAAIDIEYEPGGSNQTLSLLVCVARSIGTGSVSLYADSSHVLEIALYHSGDAVGDTGTDI